VRLSYSHKIEMCKYERGLCSCAMCKNRIGELVLSLGAVKL